MAKNITVKIGDQLQNFQGVEFLKLQTVGSQGNTSFVDQDAVSVLPFTFKFDANGQYNEENNALYQKYKNSVESGLSVNTYIDWEGALYPASSIPELNKIYAYTDIGPLDIIEITFGETVQNNIIEVIDTVFDEEKGNPASQQAIAEWVKKYVSKNGGGGAVTDEQIASAVESYFEENPIKFTESDPTVPSWAKQENKPKYTASEVGADAKGTADAKVSEHNTSNASHNDIRLLIEGLSSRLNALADSTDEDLDQLSEIVAYIKSNKELIEGVTTNKVNVSDIIDNLVTNVTNKPLSAAQGVALKALIDAITVPTKLSQLTGDSTHRVVTDAEKTAWNAKSDFSGRYEDLEGIPDAPESGGPGGKVYIVPYYSPSTITDAQKEEIRGIITAIAVEKADYALFMKLNNGIIPASYIEDSRNKTVRATLHDENNKSYQVVLSKSGEVTVSQETIYVMEQDKIENATTKAPTGTAMATYVQDYVAEHGGGGGAARVVKEVTIEEPVAYVFIPFTDFKACTTIFIQASIPKIDEEDYSLGYYRPRIKIATSAAWYSGIVLAGQKIFDADAVKIKYNAVLYSDGTNVYIAIANQRLQYDSNTFGILTAGDGEVASLNNVFTNANAGIYFEIEDRAKYQVPTGTVLTVIGV